MRLLFVSLIIFACSAWVRANDFIWPTEGKVISAFDSTRKGIDIAGKAGQPILATADGKVLYAKEMKGYGNLIILEHSDGIVTAYAHNKTILVHEGQTVSQKQQIAEMGSTGTNVVKLSFQMRQMGNPIDPKTLLPPQVVLTQDAEYQSHFEENGDLTPEKNNGVAAISWKFIRIDLNERAWTHGSDVYSVAFSPDGLQILTGSADNTAVLRDALTGQTLQTWKHEGWVNSLAFSPDGQQILTGSGDHTAVLRDAQTGKTLQTWKHKDTVLSVAFSPDGRQVLTGSADKTAVLRDATTGQTLQTWRLDKDVNSVSFSPDGQQVLISSGNTVVLRDSNSTKILQSWVHNDTVESVSFSPDGRQVLTGCRDRTTVLRDAKTGRTLQTWYHSNWVKSIAFSPDGKHVLTGLRDYTVVLLDTVTGQTLRKLNHGHQKSATYSKAVFSPDGTQVLMSSADNTAILKQSGLRSGLQRALTASLNQAETEHRSLPKSLLNRQSKLETDKPVKDEFETIAQFNHRVAQWNKAVEVLNADIQAHFAKLGSLPLAKRAKAFERAFIQSYGNPKLQDISYEPETARFSPR